MTTLATPSAPYPLIEIASLDPAAGVLVFNWLDADGVRVDSGGSIARFTPVTTGEGEALEYITPDDASLIAAITNPPPEPEAPRELSKLMLRRRLRDLGVEPQFDALLDQMPHARADWDDAQVLSTADPMFTEYAEPIRAALGLTPEQWTALIA